MAENLHTTPNNDQATAKNFQDNLTESQRLQKDLDESVRKVNLSRAKQYKEINQLIDEASGYLDNVQKEYKNQFDSYNKAVKSLEEKIAKNTRDSSQKLKAAEALAMDRAKLIAEDELKALQEEWKVTEEGFKEREKMLKAEKEGLENHSKVLNDEFKKYGVSADDFFESTVSSVTGSLKDIDEANNILKEKKARTILAINDARDELSNLSNGTEEFDAVSMEIENLNKDLNELDEQIAHNLKARRAQVKRLEKAGIKEDGTLDERKVKSYSKGSARGSEGVVESAIKGFASGGPIGGIKGFFSEITGKITDYANNGDHSWFDGDGDGETEVVDAILDISKKVPVIGTAMGLLVNTTSDLLNIAHIYSSTVTKYIDEAAQFLSSIYGTINANLEGSSYTWKSISEKADDLLSSSRWVKQTDYLKQIADLSNQGLMRDIETAAILETIKNKTLNSFDSTNEGIRRLIRLNESDYIRQFGIERQLKNVLNSVFNDSGYLQSMFDSVTSAIMDASIAQRGDTTAFNSVVQTWLGYMYSAGLSDNVVSTIASGINNLGSGNISALASDEATQRLFLLAMDRVGLDYADILQQGLSLSDTNALLGSIVSYLDEISNSTENNLVLRSSYANLFNLSTSDVAAIHNLATNYSTVSASNIADTAKAYALTFDSVTNQLQQNTMKSEQFDNFLDNFTFQMGANIANPDSKIENISYSTYKIADLVKSIASPLAEGDTNGAKRAKKIVNLANKAIDAVALVTMIDALGYGSGLGGLVNGTKNVVGGIFGTAFGSVGDTGLGALLTSSINNTSSSNSADIVNAVVKSASNTSNSSNTIKKLAVSSLSNTSATYTASEDYDKEEDNPILTVLLEMAGALMKSKSEESKRAFAVSLEGMNNNVLRAFASIFADEDAMLATFKGDNKAIESSLFNYLDDKTSNSTIGDSTSANTKTNGTTSATINGKTVNASSIAKSL